MCCDDLDVEVLSKACPERVTWTAKRTKGAISREQFLEWEQKVQRNVFCNYTVICAGHGG